MKSINRTLMFSLSLAGAAFFVLAVLTVAATQIAGWNPDRICKSAISIVTKTLMHAPAPDSPPIFSATDQFSALYDNSPKLWFLASSGTASYEFNSDHRPQLFPELFQKARATKAILTNNSTKQTVCLQDIETPADGHLFLAVANAQPSIRMSAIEFFKTAFLPLTMVGAAFAAIVATGVFFAGRFVRKSIERVTRMALAIDPAAPRGAIPLDETPAELQVLVKSLNGAFDEIARFIERQRRFLGNAAHELRTPLAILRTKLESVADSKLRAALVLDTRRLTSLVSAMLDLSRLKGDGLVMKPVDLVEITRDVLADYGPLALDQGVDLSLISDCNESIIVLGSEDAIRSAIANLIGNALVHACAAKMIVVQLYQKGAIFICDDGLAMSQARVSHLYKPMRSSALKHSGAGLGLSIVSEIMAAHQGSLSISTTIGGGTTVQLVFKERPTMPARTSRSAPFGNR